MELATSDWHLDKRWHILQIVALVVMAGSAVTYVVQKDSQYDKRLALIESMQAAQNERDNKQDRDVNAAFDLFRRQLDRIEAKIDRSIESEAAIGRQKAR